MSAPKFGDGGVGGAGNNAWKALGEMEKGKLGAPEHLREDSGMIQGVFRPVYVAEEIKDSHLLSTKNQALLDRWDAFFLFDLLLDLRDLQTDILAYLKIKTQTNSLPGSQARCQAQSPSQ